MGLMSAIRSERTSSPLRSMPGANIVLKSDANVNLSEKEILSLIAFLVPSEVLYPFLNNLK